MIKTEPIDWAEVLRLVDEGYISARRHPTEPLTIFNYTAKTQYANFWTPETRACRGLIVNDEGIVVARPFPKFFNYSDVLDAIPDEPFEVTEKLDGSLGILYHVDGVPFIATRGGFNGPGALAGTAMLRDLYPNALFRKGWTYLFEIIQPDYRIVVDYGDRRELILLAVITTCSGEEIPLDQCAPEGLLTVERHETSDWKSLASLPDKNREGFVIRFASGFRCKIKLAEYKRLHPLLTELNARDIWQNAMGGGTADTFLDGMPVEFEGWVREIDSGLRRQFAEIEAEAKAALYPHSFVDRKEAALWITKQKHPAVMFSMLDGKDYAQIIWKGLKPEGGVTFRCASEATA